MPDSGANREIAGLSDATMLYDGVETLAAAVAAFVGAAPARRAELRQLARRSVEHCFSIPRMALETAEALQAIIARNSGPQDAWSARIDAALPFRTP